MPLGSFVAYLTTSPSIVQIVTCIGLKYLHFLVLLKLVLSPWIAHGLALDSR